MQRLLAATLFCAITCSTNHAADGPASNAQIASMCKGRKDLAGECVNVRGRLRGYDSVPRCRIWPIGTTRLLGVADPKALPSNVACGQDFEVYADFLVCPLTEQKPTGVQMVCVASAANLRASTVKKNGTVAKP